MSPVRLEKQRRLFTGLEIPADIALALSRYRGGLPGARWAEPEELPCHPALHRRYRRRPRPRRVLALGDGRRRGLSVISRPARQLRRRPPPRPVRPDRAGPRPPGSTGRAGTLMRRVGLAPEKRKFTPHVTLARLRDTSPEDVAHYIKHAWPFSAAHLHGLALRPLFGQGIDWGRPLSTRSRRHRRGKGGWAGTRRLGGLSHTNVELHGFRRRPSCSISRIDHVHAS